MHYIPLIYFLKQPLNVSGVFIVYHQEVFTVYIYTAIGTCYTFKLTGSWQGQDGTILTLTAASHLKV
jgi:hypothetical protein